MKKNTLFLIAAFALTNAVYSQTKLVQRVEKVGDDIIIPYEKYVLPNGLTLIIHEDHSDPIVHLDVTYHVGSAREEIGRSGFAHFFEHMMFQGSDNVADEEHFKMVSEAGGNLNGSTNTDRTNYFETVPSNQLEKMLWLESDRMGFLLDAVTQKKFEVQRATVKNERGQNYDNRPYGLVNERINRALYPYGHPYSWSTIGDLVDLDRADVNDLKRFFLRWYGPNNAVVTIAGDVVTADAVKLVEKYFGSIPLCPEVKSMEKVAAVLDKNRYISYEDNIKFSLMQLSFPGAPRGSKDDVALQVLADVFGGTLKSVMYQNFEKTERAVETATYHYAKELAGEFNFVVKASDGNSLSDMEKLLRNTMKEFESKGITDEDVKKYYTQFEVQKVKTLTSVRGKASTLAAYEIMFGDANFYKNEIAMYKAITKEDVMNAYNKYIKDKPAVILSVYPKGKKDVVAEDNFTPTPTNPADGKLDQYNKLVYAKAKDTFDRSKKPASGPNPVIKIPSLWKAQFDNGLKILGNTNSETPTVTLQLTIKGGQHSETLTNSGITTLLASLMQEATKNYSAEQISEEFEKLGSTINIFAGENNVSIIVSSLTRNIDATLKLTEEILFNPKFDVEDFNRVKNQQLQEIAEQVTKPAMMADLLYNKVLYGENNILSLPVSGTNKTVQSITLDDVKKHYATYFSPHLSDLVVVGSLEKTGMLSKIEFLKNWKSTAARLADADKPYPVVEKTKIYLVNKDKAPQSQIRIGYMAMPYDATGEFYKSTLMNFALGGNFNSRINSNLREDKGYTYGANSQFTGTRYTGPYTAQAGVKGNTTDSSIVEFMKEISKYKLAGITEAELAFTKSSIGLSEALKYETPMQKAGFLRRMLEYNLNEDYIEKQNEILKNISKKEIDMLAAEKLPIDKMVIVVVGDKAKIYDNLLKLNYEVIELDNEGKQISPNKVLDIKSNEVLPKK